MNPVRAVFLISASLCLVMGGLLFFLPAEGSGSVDGSVSELLKTEETAELQIWTPSNAAPDWSGTLSASPFMEDRSAFTRIPVAPPPPPEPKINWQPELVGILGKGAARRALIIWRPQDSEAKPYKVGDETPWGEVNSVSESGVIITGRKLGLFD